MKPKGFQQQPQWLQVVPHVQSFVPQVLVPATQQLLPLPQPNNTMITIRIHTQLQLL